MSVYFVCGLVAGFLLVRLFAILPYYIASYRLSVWPHLYFLSILVVAFLAFNAEHLSVSSAQSTAYEEYAE